MNIELEALTISHFAPETLPPLAPPYKGGEAEAQILILYQQMSEHLPLRSPHPNPLPVGEGVI